MTRARRRLFGVLLVAAVSVPTASLVYGWISPSATQTPNDDPVATGEAATASVLNGVPVLAVNSPQFGARVKAAIDALADVSDADRQAIANVVVSAVTSRFGSDGETYAIQRLSAGEPLPTMDVMISDLGADVLWKGIGHTEPITTVPQAQAIKTIFEALDTFGGGVNRALGALDAPNCFAAMTGVWGTASQLSSDGLGAEHWHGARAIVGRRWFEPLSEPSPSAQTVTVGVFLAFADGSRSPLHFRVAKDSGGAWKIFGVNRNNVSSPFATVEY